MAKVLRETIRFRRNCWIALLSEAMAPALRVYVARRAHRAQTLPATWRRAVLLGADHIGDVLYNTPSMPALKRGLPSCRFIFVAPPPADQILETNPHVAGIIRMTSRPQTTSERKRLVNELRAQSLDAAICYNSGGYWRDLKLAVDAGIPNRVGYVHKGFSAWVTRPVPIRFPQPFAGYFRDLVTHLTGEAPPASLRPQIFPTSEDESQASAVWDGIAAHPDRPLVACFVRTRQPLPVWPDKSFAECLRDVNAIATVILCGSARDAASLRAINALAGSVFPVVAGQLGLRALACFLRRCAAVLTVDSGPRHIANAAGVPTVFIRNLWFNRVEAGQYVETETDVAPDGECLAFAESRRRLVALSPRTVAQAVAEILARTSVDGARLSTERR